MAAGCLLCFSHISQNSQGRIKVFAPPSPDRYSYGGYQPPFPPIASLLPLGARGHRLRIIFEIPNARARFAVFLAELNVQL